MRKSLIGLSSKCRYHIVLTRLPGSGAATNAAYNSVRVYTKNDDLMLKQDDLILRK